MYTESSSVYTVSFFYRPLLNFRLRLVVLWYTHTAYRYFAVVFTYFDIL